MTKQNNQFDLTTISAEPIKEPPVIVVYGEPGVGKTYFAVHAPAPIFFDIEGSAKKFTVAKKEITSFDAFDGWLRSLETQEHQFKTLVIDTVDWLERLIHEQVCKETGGKDITDKNNAGTGYGNGHIKAVNIFDGIRVRLNNLRKNKNMAIILLCHSKIHRMDEPDGGSYDRYTLKTHEKFSGLLGEWVEAILFIKQKTFINKEGKAVQGERVLITCGTKAAVAKNRLDLPNEVPGTWQDFINAIGTNKPAA